VGSTTVKELRWRENKKTKGLVDLRVRTADRCPGGDIAVAPRTENQDLIAIRIRHKRLPLESTATPVGPLKPVLEPPIMMIGTTLPVLPGA